MRPLRVLVVDDDAIFRSLLATVVAEAGHQVVGQAVDGAEGLHLVDELHPDLITLDLEMPSLGGLDVLARLNGDAGRVVLVSGSASAHQLAAALGLGARWHVAKRDVAAQLPGVLAAFAASR